MNQATIRDQLALARQELSEIESKRAAVLALIQGYEGWLRANGYEPVVRPSNGPKGEVSFRQAVINALRNEPETALHVHQIWHRVQAQGVVTDAKDHVSVVDAICYSLRNAGFPLKKTEPRTWKWSVDAEREKGADEEMASGGVRNGTVQVR